MKTFIDRKALLPFSRVILSFKTSYLFMFAQVYHFYRFHDELISFECSVLRCWWEVYDTEVVQNRVVHLEIFLASNGSRNDNWSSLTFAADYKTFLLYEFIKNFLKLEKRGLHRSFPPSLDQYPHGGIIKFIQRVIRFFMICIRGFSSSSTSLIIIVPARCSPNANWTVLFMQMERLLVVCSFAMLSLCEASPDGI